MMNSPSQSITIGLLVDSFVVRTKTALAAGNVVVAGVVVAGDVVIAGVVGVVTSGAVVVSEQG